jgi:hypothetical protein
LIPKYYSSRQFFVPDIVPVFGLAFWPSRPGPRFDLRAMLGTITHARVANFAAVKLQKALKGDRVPAPLPFFESAGKHSFGQPRQRTLE